MLLFTAIALHWNMSPDALLHSQLVGWGLGMIVASAMGHVGMMLLRYRYYKKHNKAYVYTDKRLVVAGEAILCLSYVVVLGAQCSDTKLPGCAVGVAAAPILAILTLLQMFFAGKSYGQFRKMRKAEEQSLEQRRRQRSTSSVGSLASSGQSTPSERFRDETNIYMPAPDAPPSIHLPPGEDPYQAQPVPIGRHPSTGGYHPNEYNSLSRGVPMTSAPPQQGFAPPQQGFAPPQQGFAPPQQGFAQGPLPAQNTSIPFSGNFSGNFHGNPMGMA
ncbi:hypothetical protein J7T55_010932 [Diaporthe amygdali]|uniref:uncharacterized protein n=1 Tax=Phomopsis amygdali TaxID=1214568 RepID=UPI0022FDF184|nr:uncharacterized protein J7T55_010932 [Diaporthe amygdali]KAJ0104466.1 hypothetical protein J7T55_010932 [Diaporthe amygdali]